MRAIKAHFDGRVIIPDEPVEFPRDRTLLIHVQKSPASVAPKARLTARELLNSGMVGLWRDRQDIGDSSQFARTLRERAQRREDRP